MRTHSMVTVALLGIALSAQAAAPRESLSQTGDGPSTALPAMALADLIREALARNPELRAAEGRAAASQARVPQAGALPDPTVTFGILNEGRPVPLETLGDKDFSEAYLGFTQDIPYAGKRGLRETVATGEVSAARWRLEETRRRIVARVSEAYDDLYAADAALDTVGESLDLLDQMARSARARLAVGQTSQQDVLDAEVELSRMEERRSLLEARRATTEAALAALLFRPPASAPAGRPDGTAAPDHAESPVRPAPLTETPLPGALDDLLARADDDSPLIQEALARRSQAETRVDLAHRERLPDFGVSLVYHDRGGLDPYYSFGGTLTLPLYAARKQARAVEEAGADLDSARGDADAARAAVRYEVTSAYLAATTADRLLRLYDEGLLKQARLSLDSAIAQYRVGRVEFATLVNSWRRLLEYGLAYQEQLAEHEKALARIAVHVGPSPGQGS